MCFHRDETCRGLVSSLIAAHASRQRLTNHFTMYRFKLVIFNRLLKIKRLYFFIFYFSFKRLYSTLYATFLGRLTNRENVSIPRENSEHNWWLIVLYTYIQLIQFFFFILSFELFCRFFPLSIRINQTRVIFFLAKFILYMYLPIYTSSFFSLSFSLSNSANTLNQYTLFAFWMEKKMKLDYNYKIRMPCFL